MNIVAAEKAAPQGALSKPNPHAARYSAAIASAVQAAPHLSILAMASIPRLPVRLRCSQNIRTLSPTRSTSLLWVDDAVTLPWLSWDSQEFRNVLAIDIDHADSLARWQDLPPHIRPHLVLDAWSGRGHAILPLSSPVCLSAQGREGPRILADLAGRLLGAALGGALLPVRSVVKSPWGRSSELTGHLPRLGHKPQFPELYEATQARGLCWHTIPGTGPVELKAIVQALAGEYWHEPAAQKPGKPWQKKRRESCPLGRNVLLFDAVRFWAYDAHEKDLAAITAEALRVNSSFSIPLPPSEVHSTARSIAKFMASRYRPRVGGGSGINRGRDGQSISDDMTVNQRQAVAAQATNQARTQATLTKISEAAKGLAADNKQPSQTAIAKASGVSLGRVKDLWNIQGVPVRSGALSGSGAAEGAREGGSISLKEYCSELSTHIQKKKEEDQKIRLYAELTARMMKRGAKPEVVPPRGAGASPELESAHKAAQAARKDCIRRQEARADREDQKAKREERLANFQTWAATNDGEAFQAFYSSEIRRWDALEILIDPDEKEELRTHLLRKFTHLKRVRQEWQKAKQGGLRRRNGFRRTPDFIDERVSRICVPRIIDDRSYVISTGQNT